MHANKGVARFDDAIGIAKSWVEFKEEISKIITDSAWKNDVGHLRQSLVKGIGSIFSRIFGKYRSASKELGTYLTGDLPKSPEERLKLLDTIIEGRAKKDLFDEETEFLKSKLGEEWRGERTPFSEIQSVLQWLQNTSKELADFTSEKLRGLIGQDSTRTFSSQDFEERKSSLLKALQAVNQKLGLSDLEDEHLENLSLLDLKNRMTSMIENTDAYGVWTRTTFAANRLIEQNCEPLLEMMREEKVSLDSAKTELAYALSEARWNHARSVKPELKELSRLDRHALVETFTHLELRRVEEVQEGDKRTALESGASRVCWRDGTN